ncbi:hypothetical protein BUALT_Bualt03G0071100 [Buddleja alternifolia]|uniref:Glabrous enhancer-binding protein-like DBD domain-containing protein n=1 Tax=Buddleja alternifolia TaxID=168488 RepID=A0AAV6Y2I7_9LAMI|nr:hypothetical protein BUALT_Bualt03G0071100 [Buddleja alternifolia]
MPKNREPEKPVESESESGEEEDDDASTEEDSHESDSEPELTQVAKKPSSSAPATLKKAQPQLPQPPSSDEEQSGSESDSDSDGPAPKVKPLASKPMDEPEKPKDGARKPRSKSEVVVTPTKSTAGKRPAEEKETDAKESKKSKKKPEAEGSEKKSNDDAKKSLFQRLWSEDDEIEVLKGMIDYSAKKKSDPVADLNAFHELIKKNLHVDVTRTQLQDKIRRLKKKYMNNKSKEKEGKDRTFTNPHEQRAYELSKKVWGNENGKENGGEKVVGSPKANGSMARKPPVKKGNAVETEAKDVKSMEIVSVEKERLLAAGTTRVDYHGATVEGRIERLGAELFETGKGLEGEKVWNKLKMEEIDAYQKLLEVKSRQSKLVLDHLKSEEH